MVTWRESAGERAACVRACVHACVRACVRAQPACGRARACAHSPFFWHHRTRLRHLLPPHRPDAAAAQSSSSAPAAGSGALAATVSERGAGQRGRGARIGAVPCSRLPAPRSTALLSDAIPGRVSPRRAVAGGTTSTPTCGGSSRASLRTRACTLATAAPCPAIPTRFACRTFLPACTRLVWHVYLARCTRTRAGTKSFVARDASGSCSHSRDSCTAPQSHKHARTHARTIVCTHAPMHKLAGHRPGALRRRPGAAARHGRAQRGP